MYNFCFDGSKSKKTLVETSETFEDAQQIISQNNEAGDFLIIAKIVKDDKNSLKILKAGIDPSPFLILAKEFPPASGFRCDCMATMSNKGFLIAVRRVIVQINIAETDYIYKVNKPVKIPITDKASVTAMDFSESKELMIVATSEFNVLVF